MLNVSGTTLELMSTSMSILLADFPHVIVAGHTEDCQIYVFEWLSKNWTENIGLQIGMHMKVWQNLYNFADEYSGWMNYQSSKAILECGYNKQRRYSWHHI